MLCMTTYCCQKSNWLFDADFTGEQYPDIFRYYFTIVILAFELDRIIGELKSNGDDNGIENVTQKVIWASSNFIALIATL